MEILKKRPTKHHLFALFVLFWIGLGVLGLFLAMAGVFYKAFFIGYLSIFGCVFSYLFFSNISFFKFTWHFPVVLMISLAAIFIFSYFTTPTIFSGRDQGSLSESAIRLSQNHKLEFSFAAEKSFFDIYGPGKALNFPGFDYTKDGNLKTSFPLGYASWLAVFYSLLGLKGFIVANSLSFLIFILSFYLTGNLFLKQSSSVILFFLTLTSFVFSWFFKFTLSENLGLALLWFSIYEFILFLKNKKHFFFLAAIISLGFLAFVRIEALAFFVTMFIIVLFKCKSSQNIYFFIGKKNLFALGVIFLAYLGSFVINKEFYKALIKAIIKPFLETKSSLIDAGRLFSLFHMGHIFLTYALFGFFLLGIIGIAYAFKQRKYEVLLPFLITCPIFIYLFVPNISSDTPWMLRRFLFAVVPTCIFYTVFLLDNFFRRRFIFYFLITALLLVNISVSARFLNFSPNKNLLSQIQLLSDKFNDTDLILVDQKATGDQWSMLSGPMNFLFGKQAVYFFNPMDIGKIDRFKFSQVYFIIPDENIDLYKKSGLYSKLKIEEDYSIRNNIIDISSRFDLPEKRDIIITGKIYSLNYQ